MTGTVCHGGKAEDLQGLVAKVRGQGVEGQEGGPETLFHSKGLGEAGWEWGPRPSANQRTPQLKNV